MSKSEHAHPFPIPPASLMVWTVNDRVIENLDVLENQFDDIRSAGFGGVVVYVRCSRYSWNDRPARRALRRISELCGERSMQYWLGPDPRFVSHQLVKKGRGLEVAVFGDRTRADVVPNFAPVLDGVFSVRCETQPRHVHTLTEVAIEYQPMGILRAYAIPASAGAFDEETVIDITKQAQFFYNARDRYVEAFGQFEPPDSDSWKVLALFRFRTNHVDFSSSSQMRQYEKMLAGLKSKGVEVDGMIWDEPGFTCTYGTLPYTKVIRKQFKKSTGSSLKKNLWKLALDSTDGSHVAIRNQYYRIVQRQVNEAQRSSNEQAGHLWGSKVVAGIHDTWHFESADMCDMTHGSLDLWESLSTKSGGFVDLGGVNDLRDPASGYYANLAAMNVIGASLGRRSRRRFAMCNLWTIGDDEGEGWQQSVMEHCVNTMAVFGTRWLAHAYGPAGTIGQERSFLGSPPLPGYPDHSTWSVFPKWNETLDEHFVLVEDSLPVANVLVVYPVETLYALGDSRADEAASQIFDLLLTLVDEHYQVDVLSSRLIQTTQPYDAVIYPYPQIVEPKLLPLLDGREEHLMFLFGRPEQTVTNKAVSLPAKQPGAGTEDVKRWLEAKNLPYRIEAPPSSWASLALVKSGAIVTLAPSRHGYSYQGSVGYAGKSVTIEEQTGLTRILLPEVGEPQQIRPRSA